MQQAEEARGYDNPNNSRERRKSEAEGSGRLSGIERRESAVSNRLSR